MKYLLCLLLIFSGCKVSNEGGITINANTEKSAGSGGDTPGGGSSSGGDTSGGGSSSGGDTSGGGSSSGGDTSGGGSSSGGDTSGGGSSSGGDTSGGGSSSGGGPNSIETGSYKRVITLTNSSSGTVDNVTFMITIDTTPLISAGKMNSDCSDIRMVMDGAQLSTWIGEDTCNTSQTDIFFLIPSFTTGEASIDLYYGNLSLSSIHDGIATFPLFFDDFNRSDLFAKVDSNGATLYTIEDRNGNPQSSMGYLSMVYNATTNKGQLKLSTGFSGYTTSGFKAKFEKSDSESLYVGAKVRWDSMGSSSFLGGGIIANQNGRQGFWRYSNSRAYRLLNGSDWAGYHSPFSAGTYYHYQLGLLNNLMNNTCWKNCNWNITYASTTRRSGIFYLSFDHPYSGYGYTLDYLFARRTLPDGDPAITIGAETGN